MKFGVDIYTSKGTAEALGWDGHRLRLVKSMDTFTIGTFEITAFDTVHDCKEPLGFVMKSNVTSEKLLYFTDTAYLKYRFNNLAYILGECNYSKDILLENVRIGKVDLVGAKRIMQSHMDIDTFCEMLMANDLGRLQQIYLLHLSDRNSDEKVFKERIQRLTGAEVYVG